MKFLSVITTLFALQFLLIVSAFGENKEAVTEVSDSDSESDAAAESPEQELPVNGKVIQNRFGTPALQKQLEAVEQAFSQYKPTREADARNMRAFQEKVRLHIESFNHEQHLPIVANFVSAEESLFVEDALELAHAAGVKVLRVRCPPFTAVNGGQEALADMIRSISDSLEDFEGPGILYFEEMEDFFSAPTERPESGHEGAYTRMLRNILGHGRFLLDATPLSYKFNGFDPAELMIVTSIVHPKKLGIVPKSLASILKQDLIEIPARKNWESFVGLALDNVLETISVDSGVGDGRNLDISVSPSFFKVLKEICLSVKPSEAAVRNCVYRTVHQLAVFSAKAPKPEISENTDEAELQTLDQKEVRFLQWDYKPRTKKFSIGFADARPGQELEEEISGVVFDLRYDKRTRLFVREETPVVSTKSPEFQEKILAKMHEIRKARAQMELFGTKRNKAAGLADYINKRLIGREKDAALLEQRMGEFLARDPQVDRPGQPDYLILIGFPGNGKSELAEMTGAFLNLSVLHINLESFAPNSMESLRAFGEHIASLIRRNQEENGIGKKTLVLFEEMDKLREVDEEGRSKPHPVIAAIKQLMTKGRVSFPPIGEGMPINVIFDLAFFMFTMNFADFFPIEADPNMTTVEDMIEIAKNLSEKPADVRTILEKMFRPETVNRLFRNLHVVFPLTRKNYEELIGRQIDSVVEERLKRRESLESLLDLKVAITENYKKYLFNDSVVPSEGARHAFEEARARFNEHLSKAVDVLRSEKIRSLTLSFDFDVEKQKLIITGLPTEGKVITLVDEKIEMTYPFPQVYGKIPRERLETAIHEFGHAYAAVLMGYRFEHATAIAPKNGIGGYVRNLDNEHESAKKMIADMAFGLGSRAMERIIRSKNPLDAKSVLDITPGAISDIAMVTNLAGMVLYKTGLDPQGGTLDWSVMPQNQETKQGLALLLRDLEDYVIKLMLKANPIEWYREKITEFARRGSLGEKEFFDLLGYPYAGKHERHPFEEAEFLKPFSSELEPHTAEYQAFLDHRIGRLDKTSVMNLNDFTAFFAKASKKRLHPPKAARGRKCGEKL